MAFDACDDAVVSAITRILVKGKVVSATPLSAVKRKSKSTRGNGSSAGASGGGSGSGGGGGGGDGGGDGGGNFESGSVRTTLPLDRTQTLALSVLEILSRCGDVQRVI
jgi:hypothetical protein